MPQYCYMSQEGEQFEIGLPIGKAPHCAVLLVDDERLVYAYRDFRAEIGVVGPLAKWPFHSTAMGVHPSQAAEAERKSVELGCPTHYDRETGDPEMRSPGHRREFCRTHSFVDLDGGYSDWTGR